MPREKPLDLDDDEADEVRTFAKRGAAPPPGAVAANLFGLAKWLLLLLGGILALIALNQNAVQAAALSGLACFLAIGARIMQAEEHGKKPK